MTQPSLDSLVHEIEATPGEHWAELLTQLRRFRASVTQQPSISQGNILSTIQQIRHQQPELLTPEEIDRQMQEERDAWDS